MHRIARYLAVAVTGLVSVPEAFASAQTPADVVITNARVYTASPTHAFAESFAGTHFAFES